MKKILKIIAAACILYTFTACNFLDVHPDDRLLREQVLGDRNAMHNVLNGVYMGMMNNNLYGAALTQTTVEVMAQRFDVRNHSEASNWRMLQSYNFEQTNIENMFGALWTVMFQQILQVNYFMDLMNHTTVNFPEHQRGMLMGEAYGLRAMFHFDLLRLFGPVPELANDQDSVMPYNNLVGTARLLPLLPANQILDSILADLETAAMHLENDYIRTQGIVRTLTIDPIANFFTNRHHRMNYFAVRALQARVLLWAGRPAEAAAHARMVLEAPLVQSGNLFAWVDRGVATRLPDPDRIFSSEVIFGVRNRDMYVNFRQWFLGTLHQNTLLNPNSSRLEEVFNEPGDLRFTASHTWLIPPDRAYRTSFRFSEPQGNQDTTFGYFQPLIRISEMHLIIAEAEGNPDYLQNVRDARELWTHINPANLMEEIEREYAREFWGEGQLFFFYKRRNIGAIPNANTDAENGRNRIMFPENYRVPLPRGEQDRR